MGSNVLRMESLEALCTPLCALIASGGCWFDRVGVNEA
jgi:hypothetical protein